MFSDEVATKLGHYVYRLIDPRNGETFYVGKGTKNRVFEHAKLENLDFINKDDEDEISAKAQRIRDIKNAGLSVIYVIHRHDVPEHAIYEVEAAVIDAFPGLSNVQGGHGSGSRGPMSTQEINEKYALPEIDWEPSEKLVLININKLNDRSSVKSILRQTQLAWRISLKRAESADYVLAVVRGVVVGAFKAHEWLDATCANFPEHLLEGEDMPSRKGFRGERAPDDIWDKYVGQRGKRIAIDGMKHIQNPIRYWPN